MGGTAWDFALRGIDREFDIPQFVAAALVRKISTNDFRLPAAERSSWCWFAKLPDSVIARIEQIVSEAFQPSSYEAFMRDARAEANADSTRVRAAFDAIYECCKQLAEPQAPPESVVGAALRAMPLSPADKDKVRELCAWALHVAPLEPLPLRPDAAVALALRVHKSHGDD